MEAMYEVYREKDFGLTVRRNGKHAFRQHFHINIEILVMRRGEYEVYCNGKSYKMKDGTIAFFDSYDIHGYAKTNYENEDDSLLIIPITYLGHFEEFRKKNKVANPIIYDPALVDKILNIVDTFLLDNPDENVKTAAVDMILALVEQKLVYEERTDSDDTILVKKILEFLERNFRGDVRLSTIASELGYTQEHLSRTFHKYIKQSVPSYTNKLRLNYLERMQSKSDKKLTELVYEAGFNSVQTYYRCKQSKSDENK